MIMKVNFLAFNHKSVNLLYLENVIRYIAYLIRISDFP